MKTTNFRKKPKQYLLCFSLIFLNGGMANELETEIVPSTFQIIDLNEQSWYEAEDRAVAREIASPRNSKLKSMSIAEIKIPAGVVIVPHHHVMEEVYYIVEGKGIMMVEDEEALVQAGQSVVIAPHQWHNIRNHTDEELRLIVTCVPAWAPELLEFDRSTIPVAD